MNKKILIIIGLCLFFLSGCNDKVYYKDITMYYPTEKFEFKTVNIDLKSTNKNDIVEEIKDNLINNKDIENNYYNAMINIDKVELIDETLNVYLAGDISNYTIAEKNLIWTGIVKSYLNFDFIYDVKFYLNDKEMEDTYGKKMENIKVTDFIAIEGQKLVSDIVICNLYFVKDNKLIKEERTFENQSAILLAKRVVEELIKGPINKEYISALPKETKLKQLEIKDGICYVDFNKAFVTKHPGGDIKETLTIYSIVNTLTELNEINSVQFLIDGEKVDEYKENYDFSLPFNRNESVLVMEE